jgi:hypothetical protein
VSVLEPFPAAARAYFLYGLVYWIGGVYLALHGVGVTRSSWLRGVSSIVLGTVFLVLIPYLLAAPRPWFERRILTRRNFARVLVAFMAFRAFKVAEVAVRRESASVALPWGGEVSYRVGAAVFFVVVVAAAVVIARAAWSEPRPSFSTRPHPEGSSRPEPGAPSP